MNQKKERDMLIHAVVVSFTMDNPVMDVPARRDLLIQNQKLQNMLTDPHRYQTAAKLLMAPTSKQERKRLGKREEQIGKQHKKVQESLRKFIVEMTVKRGNTPTKKFVRAEFAGLNNAIMKFGEVMLKTAIKKHLTAKQSLFPNKGPFHNIGS
jgi:hypothetical protein